MPIWSLLNVIFPTYLGVCLPNLTILDEVLGFRPDFTSISLPMLFVTHWVGHNRTAHLAERKKMMQGWADYLESIRNRDMGPQVMPKLD